MGRLPAGAVNLVGSLGFMWLEGWNFFDALYMTVTTLATVGYGEIHPLDRIGRIYNMVLDPHRHGGLVLHRGLPGPGGDRRGAPGGLGKAKIDQTHQKAKKSLHHMRLRAHRRNYRPAPHRPGPGPGGHRENPAPLPRLEELGYYFLTGDATRDEVLLEAGIERARGLVAVVGSDADNVYIVLTARSLNPKLFIVARGEEPGSEQKLLRAGADKVESPYRMGGQKMAHTILHPTVVTFMELAMKQGVDWSMEEVAVGQSSALLGVPLADSGLRQNLDLILVAIKRADGEMLFNPSHETPILAGDTLIALGLRKNLDALEEMVK